MPHRIIRSWRTGCWWVGCNIWYSEKGTGRGPSPSRPLLAVPNVTAYPSTASVPIIVLLYNGPLLCEFDVAIKGLIAELNWRVTKTECASYPALSELKWNKFRHWSFYWTRIRRIQSLIATWLIFALVATNDETIYKRVATGALYLTQSLQSAQPVTSLSLTSSLYYC